MPNSKLSMLRNPHKSRRRKVVGQKDVSWTKMPTQSRHREGESMESKLSGTRHVPSLLDPKTCRR
jgi:hypothetical protein